jgi:hypothetical protein
MLARHGARESNLDKSEKQMGVELELYVLLAILILGTSVFDVFEVETAKWRKTLKWFIVCAGTVGLYSAVGHFALLFPCGMGALGISFHFWWCRKNGIHPIQATPRRRYYELRGWSWPE